MMREGEGVCVRWRGVERREDEEMDVYIPVILRTRLQHNPLRLKPNQRQCLAEVL